MAHPLIRSLIISLQELQQMANPPSWIVETHSTAKPAFVKDLMQITQFGRLKSFPALYHPVKCSIRVRVKRSPAAERSAEVSRGQCLRAACDCRGAGGMLAHTRMHLPSSAPPVGQAGLCLRWAGLRFCSILSSCVTTSPLSHANKFVPD